MIQRRAANNVQMILYLDCITQKCFHLLFIFTLAHPVHESERPRVTHQSLSTAAAVRLFPISPSVVLLLMKLLRALWAEKSQTRI